jgi:(E)-4-hydroxy-3-methylbut-2-enyl-diphosphate synthase
VSLTEDPWEEIDPCKRLIHFFNQYLGKGIAPFVEKQRRIEEITRREVKLPEESFLHRDGSVILKVEPQDLLKEDFFSQIGCKTQLGLPEPGLSKPDALFVEEMPTDEKTLKIASRLKEIKVGLITRPKGIKEALLLKNLEEIVPSENPSEKIAVLVKSLDQTEWKKLLTTSVELVLLKPEHSRLHQSRLFFEWAREQGLKIPIIFYFDYSLDVQDLIIASSAECGALLGDGLGEGICLKTTWDLNHTRLLSFNIMPACRMRTSKTEFISSPGCGRTLFELQTVSKRIREKTSHLPGVKIAIMGCIVNGAGEMADADFGYVGSKAGKIDLYIGKTCVERNIDFSDADERLIELIKAHGRWVEPEVLQEV